MSRIKRGPAGHIRKRAKNFTQKQAQARLDEVVPVFNEQVENSLFVNAVDIDYYHISKVGRPCTCEKVEVVSEFSETENTTGEGVPAADARVIPTVDSDGGGIAVKLQDDNIFGDSEAEKMYGTQEYDVSGEDLFNGDDDIPGNLQGEILPDGNVEFAETTMFGSNANCGICYKQGLQPGYRLHGTQRFVLSTLNADYIGSYHVNRAEAPNSFQRQGPESEHTFVDFIINVPKYFTACMFSIRNNRKPLPRAKLSVRGKTLTDAMLRHYAGNSMRVRVTEKEFTHVVMEFDLGHEKIRANLGPETQELDYSRGITIGDFPVVLPPSLNDVNTLDIIVIRDRRLVLKVTSKERKITSDKKQLEWVVQARVVQTSEALKLIDKKFKVI